MSPEVAQPCVDSLTYNLGVLGWFIGIGLFCAFALAADLVAKAYVGRALLKACRGDHNLARFMIDTARDSEAAKIVGGER